MIFNHPFLENLQSLRFSVVDKKNTTKLMKINEIADLIQIIGMPIIIIQLYYAVRSYRDEHERARRENAVNYLTNFIKAIDQKSSIARKVIELFSDSQCDALSKKEEISVEVKRIEEIKAIFSCKTPNGKNYPEELRVDGQNIILNEEQSSYLMWLAMTYLNSIESLLLAWRHNVADRAMIEEECENLVDKNGSTILEKLRGVIGKEACPAIDEFVNATREKNRTRPAKKPPLGNI